jgi:hypothetical protein
MQPRNIKILASVIIALPILAFLAVVLPHWWLGLDWLFSESVMNALFYGTIPCGVLGLLVLLGLPRSKTKPARRRVTNYGLFNTFLLSSSWGVYLFTVSALAGWGEPNVGSNLGILGAFILLLATCVALGWLVIRLMRGQK